MKNNLKVCENKIDFIQMELYTNNDKESYQQLIMTVKGVNSILIGVIAPVDFFKISSAIMCSTSLDDFIENVKGTWSENILKDTLNQLEKEVDLSIGVNEAIEMKEL